MNHMKFPYLPACCLSKTYSDDTLLPSRPWHNDFVFYSVCISLANIFQDTILNSSFYLCLTTRPLCELGGGKKKAKQWYKPRNLTLLTSDPFWSQWSWDLCLETDYRFYSWNSFIQSPRILFRFFLLTRVLSIRDLQGFRD